MKFFLEDDKELKKEILKDIRDKDFDIDEYVSDAIEELTEAYSKFNMNQKFFGINAPLNAKRSLVNAEEIYCNYIWFNFIPHNVKIVYGFEIEDGKLFENGGYYYYIDDDRYLKDFINYIKDKKIESDFEFISYVHDFLKDYFSDITNLSDKNREKRHQALKNKSDRFIEPIKHSNSIFYKSNSALCTEYSTMALNILSFFGYTGLSIFGSIGFDGKYSAHAYNIINLSGKNHLIDFSCAVEIYDIYGNKCGEQPYAYELGEEEINKIINSEKIDCADYFVMCGNDSDIIYTEDTTRTYKSKDLAVSLNNKKIISKIKKI